MAIVIKINSTHSQVNPNIHILKREGIIIESQIGRIRLIKLDRNSYKTKLLLNALMILESDDQNNCGALIAPKLQMTNIERHCVNNTMPARRR
jgi:biotin operon repressor